METKNLYAVSTCLIVKGDFSNISDNFSILADPTIFNSDNHIVLSNMLCDVEMEELNFEHTEITLYINIPIMAFNEELAEEIAKVIVNNAAVDSISLLDNTTNQIYTVNVKGEFANVEYHIA